MLMKSWAILGFDKPIIYSKHNICGKGCNYRFSSLFLDVWCMSKCGCHSTHLYLIYGHCPSWGLIINGIWVLLIHWIWSCDIINTFWLWSSNSKWLELVPLLNHNKEGTTYTFFDRVFSRFGILVEVFTNQL